MLATDNGMTVCCPVMGRQALGRHGRTRVGSLRLTQIEVDELTAQYGTVAAALRVAVDGLLAQKSVGRAKKRPTKAQRTSARPVEAARDPETAGQEAKTGSGEVETGPIDPPARCRIHTACGYRGRPNACAQ